MSTAATAAQLKDRFAFTWIKVPDCELEVKCRRPDPLDAITRGILPLPIFSDILERAAQGHVTADVMRRDPATYAEFINRWVCAAVVEPRIVLTAEELADYPEAICVEDLPIDFRAAIFGQTSDRLVSRALGATVAEFRREQSSDPDPGPGGEAVRDASVASAPQLVFSA